MIVVGGENLIDFIQVPSDGGHPLYRAIPGGSPFNTAKAIVRQGQATGYLTPFSDDTLGQVLREDLLRDPVVVLSADSPRPTSLAVVSLTDGQARYQFYREGTAERDITLDGLTAALPDQVSAFYVGSLAVTDGPDAEVWSTLFARLSDQGVFCAFDPNIRPAFIHDRAAYMDRFETLITQAALVKLSDEDMDWLFPGEDMDTALADIHQRSGAGLAVLTRGGDGAVAMHATGRHEVPVVAVPDLKDTVGAGDTFMGSLVAGCLREGWRSRDLLAAAGADQIRDLLQLSAKAAAINCGRVGCDPPTLAELMD